MNNLEFVHITKTAGTSIEKWGLQYNIKWGKEKTGPYQGPFWHSTKKTYLNEKSISFMCVRNPYTRLISEYYCPWLGYAGNHCNVFINENPNTKEHLNKWIREFVKKGYEKHLWHGTPQYLYLPVDNIIYFENLQNDFTNLLRKHNINYNPKLPKVNKSKIKKKFNISDLDEETINLINCVYKKDFEIFGYKLIKSQYIQGFDKDLS